MDHKPRHILSALLIVLMGMVMGFQVVPPPDNQVLALVWNSTTNRMALATQFGDIFIVDMDTGISISLKTDLNSPVYALAWTDDGERLTASHDKTITIWNTNTMEVLLRLEATLPVRALGWNHDSTLLAGISRDGSEDNFYIWDATTGQILMTAGIGDALDLAWAPLGQRIAISRFAEIQIWDMASSVKVKSIQTPEYAVSISWSPDGNKIASADTYLPQNSVIRIWDVDSGSLLSTLQGHTDVINTVEWDTVGNIVVTASHDKTVRLWNVENGKQLEIYKNNHSLYGAAFSPYGGLIAFTDKVSENVFASLQIVVPDPSIDRLNAIAELCVRDASTQSRAVSGLTSQRVTSLNALPDFVAQVESLPEGAIPPACRADLLAVADALR